jgi:hypothetical protein
MMTPTLTADASARAEEMTEGAGQYGSAVQMHARPRLDVRHLFLQNSSDRPLLKAGLTLPHGKRCVYCNMAKS